MSLTKSLLERETQKSELRAVLQALLDNEYLDHAAAVGIAKKVISDGDESQLTAKQLRVYDDHIRQKFEMQCESEDCGNAISFSDLPDAIGNEATGDSVLCEACVYYEHQMSKDD